MFNEVCPPTKKPENNKCEFCGRKVVRLTWHKRFENWIGCCCWDVCSYICDLAEKDNN